MLKVLSFLIKKRVSIWHQIGEKFYQKITEDIVEYSNAQSKIVIDNKDLYLYLKDKVIDKTILNNTNIPVDSYVIGSSKSSNIYSSKTYNHIIGLDTPKTKNYNVIVTYDNFGDVKTILCNGLKITDNFLPNNLIRIIEHLNKTNKSIILSEYKLYKPQILDMKESLLKLFAYNDTSISFYAEDDSNVNQYISQYIDMLPKNNYLMCLSKHDRKLNCNKDRCILTPYYADRIINKLEDCTHKIIIPIYKGCRYSFMPKGDYVYVVGDKSLHGLTKCNVLISENRIQDIVYNNSSMIFNKMCLLQYLEKYKNNKITAKLRYCTI